MVALVTKRTLHIPHFDSIRLMHFVPPTPISEIRQKDKSKNGGYKKTRDAKFSNFPKN